MHDLALEVMTRAVQVWPHGRANCLDVGSFDRNGTYRPLIVDQMGWQYTGVDIQPGPNVDVVSGDAYHYPFADGMFDVVISGSTMEHVPEIWRWVPELVRLLRPGGLLIVITHTHWRYHPDPVDCWRIMPDGMRYLFDATKQLERYAIEMNGETDILGLAWKVGV